MTTATTSLFLWLLAITSSIKCIQKNLFYYKSKSMLNGGKKDTQDNFSQVQSMLTARLGGTLVQHRKYRCPATILGLRKKISKYVWNKALFAKLRTTLVAELSQLEQSREPTLYSILGTHGFRDCQTFRGTVMEGWFRDWLTFINRVEMRVKRVRQGHEI